MYELFYSKKTLIYLKNTEAQKQKPKPNNQTKIQGNPRLTKAYLLKMVVAILTAKRCICMYEKWLS